MASVCTDCVAIVGVETVAMHAFNVFVAAAISSSSNSDVEFIIDLFLLLDSFEEMSLSQRCVSI